MVKETVLVISDTQAPFQHVDTIPFLKALKKKYNPTKVVHIGDALDMHALSDYVKDPDGYGAGMEFEEGLKFMRELYKLFPEVVILESNHDVRYKKRAIKAGLPRRCIRDYNEVFEAPKGWKWRSKVIIDGIVYIHGHTVHAGGGNVMQNAVRKYMKSVVLGHFHTRFGLDYHANEDSLFFGCCVGSLIDHKAYAFAYQSAEVRKPIIGTAVIDKGHPILEPMLLKEDGRWVGKL